MTRLVLPSERVPKFGGAATSTVRWPSKAVENTRSTALEGLGLRTVEDGFGTTGWSLTRNRLKRAISVTLADVSLFVWSRGIGSSDTHR